MPDTLIIPATVEIPGDAIAEIVARLLALEEECREFTGRQDNGLDQEVQQIAFDLLMAAGARVDRGRELELDPDYAHPITVQAFARAHELTADRLRCLPSPEAELAEAARIREKGYALAGYYDDEQLQREIEAAHEWRKS